MVEGSKKSIGTVCLYASGNHKLRLRRKQNLIQSVKIASFGVFEYCFDSFDLYKRDVGAVMSKYGYSGESDDVSSIDKFFGVAFTEMADWPSG